LHPVSVQPPGVSPVQFGHRGVDVSGGDLGDQIGLLTGQRVIDPSHRHL